MSSRFNPRLRRLILIGRFVHVWLSVMTVGVKLALADWTKLWS